MITTSTSTFLNRFVAATTAAILLVVLTGCGGSASTATVTGTVTLDGEPLAEGAIVTRPEAGRGAQGLIRNGQFTLGTMSGSDGAIVGLHKVAIVAHEKGQAGPEGKPGKLLVPERYTNPESSGLTIDVTAGNNTPKLELTTK